MLAYLLPVFFALFLWWFSTAAIAFADGLPRRTFRWSLLGASVLAVAALHALAWSSATDTVLASFVGFTAAIIVWGWTELSFLTGHITGPRRAPCPRGATGWLRLRCAIAAIAYHEIAIIAAASLVFWVTQAGVNDTGLWTFLLLWIMRISAKLNVYLGVRNLSEELLPDHMSYLATYFRRAPMNPLFPVSVSIGTIAVVVLMQAAMAPDASPALIAGYSLLAALMALALLEHWLMIIPLPAGVLWAWYFNPRMPDERVQSRPKTQTPDARLARVPVSPNP